MGKIKTIRYQQIYRKTKRSTSTNPLLKLRPVPKCVEFVPLFPFGFECRDCRTFLFSEGFVGKVRRIVEQVCKKSANKFRWKTWKGKPEITTQEENIF